MLLKVSHYFAMSRCYHLFRGMGEQDRAPVIMGDVFWNMRSETTNNSTYHEILSSGLGSLLSLGVEVYGRWGPQSIKLVPLLAREKARGAHPLVRKGLMMSLQHRWWGCWALIAAQRAVARTALNEFGDLPRT